MSMSRFRRDIFHWALNYNLNYIVLFHNGVRALLKEKLQDPEWHEDRQVQDTLEHFDKMNSANSLLVTLAFLEEMLIICWRKKLPGDAQPKGSAIDRYKRLLKSLGRNPGALSCWATLQDSYKVRHCLLHANGRLSFMKQPAAMRSCIERNSEGLCEDLDRLVVNSFFLEQCVKAVGELRDEMLKALS